MGERSFIDSVHRQINPEWKLHKQSMTGVMGANGTPDYYYESFNNATWIEYKFVKTLPKIIDLTDRKKQYSLSALQNRWLDRTHRNGTRAAAVLGSLEGAIIFVTGSWNYAIETAWVKERGCLITASDVAEFARGANNNRIIIQHE